MIFGVIYRHPGSNVSIFQKSFEKLIFNLNISKKPTYITGDFNIDCTKGSNIDYTNSISSFGYHQFVNSPTRYSFHNNSSKILDHFYSNQLQTTVQVKILLSDITDHLPVFAWIKKPHIPNNRPKKSFVRDMKSFRAESFTDDLYNKFNTITIDIDDDINTIYNTFTKFLLEVINKHAPYKELSRRETKLKQKPWLTKDLLKSIRRKNKLYRKFIKSGNPEELKAYKTLSKSLNYLQKQSKKKYYDELIKKSTKNSKQTWKVINDIVQLKKGNGKGIVKIEDKNGNEVSEPAKISEIFNQFFVSIGQKLSNSFSKNTDVPPLQCFQKKKIILLEAPYSFRGPQFN